MTRAVSVRVVGDVPGVSYDLWVGRPSKWGNPFKTGRDGSRKEVLAKYRQHILNSPELMADLPELKDKTLACACARSGPTWCHAGVLVELVEQYCA